MDQNPCEEGEKPLGKHKIYWCRACDKYNDPLLDNGKIDPDEGVCVYGKCYSDQTLKKHLIEAENKEVDIQGFKYNPKLLQNRLDTARSKIPPPEAHKCLNKESKFLKDNKQKKYRFSTKSWDAFENYKNPIQKDDLYDFLKKKPVKIYKGDLSDIRVKDFIEYWDYENFRKNLKKQGFFPRTEKDWKSEHWKKFIQEQMGLKKAKKNQPFVVEYYKNSLTDLIEEKKKDTTDNMVLNPVYILEPGKEITWEQSQEMANKEKIQHAQTHYTKADINTIYTKTSTKKGVHSSGRTASVGKGEILFGEFLGLKPSGPNKSYDFIFKVNNRCQEADVKEADKDSSITTGKRGAVIALSLLSGMGDLLKKLLKVTLDAENNNRCPDAPLTCFSNYLYPKEINDMNLLVAKWKNDGLHEVSQGDMTIFKNIIDNLNYMKTNIQQTLIDKKVWKYNIDTLFTSADTSGKEKAQQDARLNSRKKKKTKVEVNAVKAEVNAVKAYKILSLLYSSDVVEQNLNDFFGNNYYYIKFLVDLDHPYVDNPEEFNTEFTKLSNIFEDEWLIFVKPTGYYIMKNPREEMAFHRITQGKPRFKPKSDKLKTLVKKKP